MVKEKVVKKNIAVQKNKGEKLSVLQFLVSDFSHLKRVADYFSKNLVNLVGCNRIFNLLLLRPLRAEIVLFCPKIFEVASGVNVILKLKIESHVKPQNRRQPHRIVCYSPSGFVSLVFFKTYPGQMEKFAVGREIAVFGELTKVDGVAQIVHPKEIVDAAKIDELPKKNLVYPLSGALTQKFVRAKILEILRFINSEFDKEKAQKNDWIDRELRNKQGWPLFVEALNLMHDDGEALGLVGADARVCPYENCEMGLGGDLQQKAFERLKYDELLAWQLAMLLVRKREQRLKEIPNLCDEKAEEFLRSLPFSPTNAQMRACDEIRQNILSNKVMLRLLQGDVGSGKTVVAIYSCLLANSCGFQACVIVPISLLAVQHFEYFSNLIGRDNVALLTSKTTKKQRDKILKSLKNGEIKILIGTHAILQDDVEFCNLGLAVIDEQHRFGVMQRLKLIEKGENVDVLLMSATPIPRSLMMSFYGDMDISILDEKPANRLAIETVVMSQKRSGEVYDGVKRAMARGEKVYWICPLIDEGESIDGEEKKSVENSHLQAAESKFEELAKVFGKNKVALIHGKMKEAQKEKTMEEFRGNQELQILVATTVIEVGVDIKNATIIVIENAENFGLSQLHQLRGRVGRGDKQSYCILLYGKKYGKIAQERLKIMRQSNDGFFIAEEDLKLRGSGELLGTKQSGVPEFCVADLQTDLDLLKIAGKNAQKILHEDENLIETQSAKFRVLLKLFDYEDCLKIMQSG